MEPPRKGLVSLTELSGTAKELPGSASASGESTSSAESKLGMAASGEVLHCAKAGYSRPLSLIVGRTTL